MVHVRMTGMIYRKSEYVGIYFEPDARITGLMRKQPACRWSVTQKCWLMPLNREGYQAFVKQLKGIASIDDSQLRKYLLARKENTHKVYRERTASQAHIPGGSRGPARSRSAPVSDRKNGIDKVNEHVLPEMEQHLKLKSYSISTIKTYLNEVSPMLRLLGTSCADDLTVEELKRYFVYCYDQLKLSENTLHSRINALKFYYEQVRKRERFFWEIPRPKKHLQLPKLLNEGELARLFNALPNKKHKAMLFTAYSAGLRVSEIVNLKLADIDSKRMQIFIGKSKGKKDRYVNLSPLLLDILREYVREYVPRPRLFLFESEQTGTAYPPRTVQQIFSNARAKAGILKKVGIHSLRHSFATHLLDKGTDIKYIKDLLGHFNIKTTERYLHVSKQKLVNIESPFDDLWKRGNIQW